MKKINKYKKMISSQKKIEQETRTQIREDLIKIMKKCKELDKGLGKKDLAVELFGNNYSKREYHYLELEIISIKRYLPRIISSPRDGRWVYFMPSTENELDSYLDRRKQSVRGSFGGCIRTIQANSYALKIDWRSKTLDFNSGIKREFSKMIEDKSKNFEEAV